MNPKPRTYAAVALDEQAELMEKDPDLAWVEREIDKCLDGPRSIYQDTPALNRLRNERLARLQKLRAKLLGEEIH